MEKIVKVSAAILSLFLRAEPSRFRITSTSECRVLASLRIDKTGVLAGVSKKTNKARRLLSTGFMKDGQVASPHQKLKVEAAGIEPASRDESAISSTCVVVDLNFVRTTGQRHPEIQTSLKLNLTIRVSNMTDCDLELVTSSLGSPAKPISRGSLFLGSHCERVIFCK